MSWFDELASAVHDRKDDLSRDAVAGLLAEAKDGADALAKRFRLDDAERARLAYAVDTLAEDEAQEQLASLTRHGFALLAAGVSAGQRERALELWLERQATFEQRQSAILRAAGRALAEVEQRRAEAAAAMEVLEGLGRKALNVLALLAAGAVGLA